MMQPIEVNHGNVSNTGDWLTFYCGFCQKQVTPNTLKCPGCAHAILWDNDKSGVNEMEKMKQFTDLLIKLSGVSIQYADAAWFTCSKPENNPKSSANFYYERFLKAK